MTNPNDYTKAQAAMLKFGRAMPTPEQLARVTTAARAAGASLAAFGDAHPPPPPSRWQRFRAWLSSVLSWSPWS